MVSMCVGTEFVYNTAVNHNTSHLQNGLPQRPNWYIVIVAICVKRAHGKWSLAANQERWPRWLDPPDPPNHRGCLSLLNSKIHYLYPLLVMVTISVVLSGVGPVVPVCVGSPAPPPGPAGSAASHWAPPGRSAEPRCSASPQTAPPPAGDTHTKTHTHTHADAAHTKPCKYTRTHSLTHADTKHAHTHTHTHAHKHRVNFWCNSGIIPYSR